MSTRDGGPAFPVDLMDVDSMGEMKVRYQEPGMSLRDWFAGQALAGLAAQNPGARTTKDAQLWRDGLSVVAYAVADAMLAARKKG